MKKQVSPAVMTVVIALVVVGAVFVLMRAANDKPAYPGMNAGKPAGEVAGGGNGGASVPVSQATYEQAKKMHISGMAPGAKAPQSPPSGQ